MLYKIILIKVLNLKNPNKTWKNPEHFYSQSENRSIQNSLIKKYSDFEYNKKMSEAFCFQYDLLSEDKKSLYKFFLVTKEIHDFDYKNSYEPYEKNGLLKFETVFEYSIDQKVAMLIGNFYRMLAPDTHFSKKTLKFFKKNFFDKANNQGKIMFMNEYVSLNYLLGFFTKGIKTQMSRSYLYNKKKRKNESKQKSIKKNV